jgi:hypothetical protein
LTPRFDQARPAEDDTDILGVSLRQRLRAASSRQAGGGCPDGRLRSSGLSFAWPGSRIRVGRAPARAPATDVAAVQQAERSLAARLADLLPETQLSLIVQAVPMKPPAGMRISAMP